MLARVVTTQIKLDEIDDAIEDYDELIALGRKSKKDAQGGLLLIDHETGNVVSITFWHEGHDMKGGRNPITSGDVAYLKQLQKFKKHFAVPIVDEAQGFGGEYKVSVQG